MYYLIEKKEQLDHFLTYDLSKCYFDIISNNDNCHPAESKVSLIYIKPFRSRMGFIISISHTESFGLDLSSTMALLSHYVAEFYVYDAKRIKYYLNTNKPLFCLKMALYLNGDILIDETEYNTTAHNFYYSKYPYLENINMIIPISKHFEKYNNLYTSLKWKKDILSSKSYSFYNEKLIDSMFYIESQGISIDKSMLLSKINVKSKEIITESITHSQYNLFTVTGRPSNSFNGINYSALEKEHDVRSFIISKNFKLVEFDYSSYHVKILSDIIEYKFDEDDIHSHLGKQYFKTESLSKQQYDESKHLTFKYMYTDYIPEELSNVQFFIEVKKFKEKLWDFYNKKGYIKSPISGRKLSNISSKSQLLPYLLQCLETEQNILIIEKIKNLLFGKKTRPILYMYDAFLFDLDEKETDILSDIKSVIESEGYKTSIKYGVCYNVMKSI